MARDEVATLSRLKACRAIIDGLIATHRGRIFNTAGDSVVADFASAVDAVQCAVAVQAAILTENAGLAADEPMQFRIGVHVGDVIVEGSNLLGDSVNIAARLEALAEPGSIYVSAPTRDHIGNKLPLAFDDLGDQQVKNIPQAIRVYRVQAETLAAKPIAALPLPDKPSIAVWLFVIARNSSFTYKGQAVDVKQVGRELGVRYVLEGSVRKADGRVRITAQLIEAITGAHLWADRFDGSLEDVFELQDKVASSVAGVIEPALQAAETARSENRPTNDLTAYDLYLRAYAMVLSSMRQSPQALRLLERAIARDPRYGPALALAAYCCYRLLLDGRSEDREVDRLKGAGFARQALEVAGDDPVVLVHAALALAWFGEDIGAMLALVDRALTLNPNYARGWQINGVLRSWAGEPDIAIEHVETALRLSPRARVGTSFLTMGMAHFVNGRFDAAVPKLLVAIQEDPSLPAPYCWLAACYAHMGRLDAAREIVTRLRASGAIVMGSGSTLRNWEHRELFLTGMRLAMGEEG